MVDRVQVGAVVQHLLLALAGLRHGDAAHRRAAVEHLAVDRAFDALARDDQVALGVRVLHEVASHLVVLVAQTGRHDVARHQQHANVLDAPGRQHIVLGHDVEARPRQRPHRQPRHGARRRVGLDRQHVGVVVHAHVGHALQGLAVHQAEAGGRAEAVDRRLEPLLVERQRLGAPVVELGHRAVDVVIVAGHFQDLVGQLVVALELGLRERPAAVGDPRPVLEIDRVQRPAPAAPGVGAAAQIPQLAHVQRVVRQADVGRGVQRLVDPLEVQPAAFQQGHRQTRAGQLHGHRDPGRTGTDDRYVHRDDVTTGQLACIEKHKKPAYRLGDQFGRRAPGRAHCSSRKQMARH